MAKWHINPETGDAGVCKATQQCRFGGEEDHFSTKKEASLNAEKMMMKNFSVLSSFQKTSDRFTKITDVHTLAVELMKEHGVFDLGYTFSGFNASNTALGITKVSPQGGGSIELSKNWSLAVSKDTVRNTILHEIAHAKSQSEHGAGISGHGAEWKREAEKLGIDPDQFHHSTVEELNGNFAWKSICPRCGANIFMGKAPTRPQFCPCVRPEDQDQYSLLVPFKHGESVDIEQMPSSYKGAYKTLARHEPKKFSSRPMTTVPTEAQFPELHAPKNFSVQYSDNPDYFGGRTAPKADAGLDPEFIEALKMMYLKKFGTHPDEDGVEVGELLALFNKGELS